MIITGKQKFQIIIIHEKTYHYNILFTMIIFRFNPIQSLNLQKKANVCCNSQIVKTKVTHKKVF